MNIDAFRSSRRAPTDADWAEVQENLGSDAPPREACHMYAEGYLIHEADGKFWPHAWWYSPVPKDTLAEAEEVLLEWRAEFA